MKCKGFVYQVGFEEEDLNKGETIKPLEMFECLAPNQEVCRLALLGTELRRSPWGLGRVSQLGGVCVPVTKDKHIR